jgi:hypothetical protein
LKPVINKKAIRWLRMAFDYFSSDLGSAVTTATVSFFLGLCSRLFPNDPIAIFPFADFLSPLPIVF